jgi:hypothetical protein
MFPKVAAPFVVFTNRSMQKINEGCRYFKEQFVKKKRHQHKRPQGKSGLCTFFKASNGKGKRYNNNQ